MITFVPGFISADVVAHDRRQLPSAIGCARRCPTTRPGSGPPWRRGRQANPEPRATLAQVADHIDHVRKVAGIDHLGLGSDFDGITTVPVGLEDVSKYPALTIELLKRGYSDDDVKKILGLNVLRVIRQVERVAAELHGKRGPSTATLQGLDGAK